MAFPRSNATLTEENLSSPSEMYSLHFIHSDNALIKKGSQSIELITSHTDVHKYTGKEEKWCRFIYRNINMLLCRNLGKTKSVCFGKWVVNRWKQKIKQGRE